MFKKIVSNLPFSPALVGQLGFYAKRLRKEEATRRLGLVFVVLALLVQSLAVFQPSESANASSSSDMVNGGISSINNFLSAYDSNTKHLRDTMNYAGISRAEIVATKYGTWQTGDKLSWGYASRFSYAQGERQHIILNESGQKVTTAYSRPLSLWGSKTKNISGWIGYSSKMGWFAIMKSCGNLVTNGVPVVLKPKTPIVTPKPKTPIVEKENPVANIIMSKTATNTSQGFIEASSITALASDQISYTISAENTGTGPAIVKLEDNVSDVLEYATIIDNGGGTLNEVTEVLSWPDITLNPKDKQTRTFVVKILNQIPATSIGASDPTSFDCNISNNFGNTTNVRVDCPGPKIVEKVATELPKTGPTENMIFAGIVLAIATYFYAQTRQVKREVYLIRQDVSSGTI